VVSETELSELSALCPSVGLPNYGVVRVEYVPCGWVLVLKSQKGYFVSWREGGGT
jgi:7-cyano-7-deazaguanine reductase